MKLGVISLWGDELDAFRREIRLAEELGYEVITVGETPFAWHDVYAALGVAAAETATATLSSMVTTPYLRHPVASASAMFAFDELSGGRAVMAIGTGGSVAKGIGRLATSAEYLREYVLALRSLFAGEPITWEGTQVTRMRHARPIPIYVSGYGPKALALAGEIADGVVLSVGSSLERVEQNVAIVRAAAERAGRDPDSVDVWAYSYVSIRDNHEEALDDIKAFLATTAAFRLRAKHLMDRVPADLREGVLELGRRYDTAEHVVVGGHNARLVDEFGLAEYLAGESAVAGTPDEVRQTVAGLAERGVTCLIAALPGNADPLGTIRRFSAAASPTAVGASDS